ncbi:TolC family protein [Alienimonas sp. DA493]|uniref:TolC family protein n=1 Tax=Alienimonas sp. DA493 TaxID=3373605 RepID=UPI00375510E7
MKPRKALLPFALASLAGCGTGNALTTHTYDGGSPLASGAAAGYGVPAVAVAAVEPALDGSIQPAAYQEEPSVDEGRDRPVTADPFSPERPSDELAEEAANEARDTGPSDAGDGADPLAAPVPLPVDVPVDGVLPDDHPPGGLTLAEIEAAALSANPTLSGAAAAVDKARGIYTQVGLYPNPTVGYTSEEIGEGGSAGQHGVFASQTFVTADKLKLNRAVESWEVERLRWRTEAQRLRVVNGVRRQYYVALGAQRRLELAEELVDLAEEGVAAAEQLFEAGEVARPDVLQVEIQLGEVNIVRRDAELEFEGAWQRLMALAGMPSRPVGRLDGELEGPVAEHDFDALFAELLAASPELAAARARVSRARTAICRQQAQPVPNVQTQAAVTYGFGGDEPIGGVQVGLPLPVFNDNRGNVAAAVADLHRATADLRRLELDLRARLADALRDYRRAANRVARYTEDVLPAARENLALTEEGYRQGEFDIVRVFTARRSFFEANLARVAALADARTSEVAVDGLLLVDALGEIPDAGGENLQGVGLRDLALGGQ